MKKIILLIIAIFWLLSCWNENIIKKEIVKDKNPIKYNNIWKKYYLSINNKKDLIKLNDLFLKKRPNRYEIWFNIPFNDSFSDYFKKLKGFDYLYLDIILDKWNDNIEKTLKIISEKSKSNKDNSNLAFSFIGKNYFTENEYKILEKMKISVLEIQWFDIKWKNIILDNKINWLLEKSKTLNKIIIQDYKIFKK